MSCGWNIEGNNSAFRDTEVFRLFVRNVVPIFFPRGHLLRLQRGEKNFLPKEVFDKKPSAITVKGNNFLERARLQQSYLETNLVMLYTAVSSIPARLKDEKNVCELPHCYKHL